jgi:hypothetical protein
VRDEEGDHPGAVPFTSAGAGASGPSGILTDDHSAARIVELVTGLARVMPGMVGDLFRRTIMAVGVSAGMPPK